MKVVEADATAQHNTLYRTGPHGVVRDIMKCCVDECFVASPGSQTE
jgi:hypothetical protein